MNSVWTAAKSTMAKRKGSAAAETIPMRIRSHPKRATLSLTRLMAKRISQPPRAIPVRKEASMVVTAIHNFGFANGLEILGTFGAVFTLVILVIAVALVAYARAMARRGVLT